MDLYFKKQGEPYACFRCPELSKTPIDLHVFSYFCGKTRGPLTRKKWSDFLIRKGKREVAHPNSLRTGKGRGWDNHSAGLRLVPVSKNPRGRKGWKCIRK